VTLRPSLAWRIVLVTLVASLFGAIVALAIAERVVGDALGDQVAPLLVNRFGPFAARACEASPSSWSWSLPMWHAWGMQGYAYDEAARASPNRSAPPLRDDLVERLGAEADASAIDVLGPNRSGAIVFRSAARAPCNLIQVVWRNPHPDRRFTPIVGGSAAASAAFGSALALLAIAFPLVRRIRRLSAAASRVGEPTGYVPLGRPASGDELDALEDRLDRAHLRIRSDAQMLEDQRDALERHLAHIAHDLRTPLTSLQMALEYAADISAEPAVRDALTGALRDAVYLSGLTYNLRLASKLRSGWDPTHDAAPLDLADLVTRIVERARILARRRQVELALSVPDGPVRVVCNAVAVEQALSNVVDNAVAYGDPHGHVAVVLAVGATGFDLEVRDDGPGVDPAILPRLGQATFRSDEARQRDPRGSGLGLAITAEVCARIGWTLGFTALEPRGLLVHVHGHVHSAPATAPPPAAI